MNCIIDVLQIDVPVKAGQYSVIYPEQYYGVFGKAEPTDKFFIICKYQPETNQTIETNQSDLLEFCISLDCS